jgi:hypothetical protein
VGLGKFFTGLRRFERALMRCFIRRNVEMWQLVWLRLGGAWSGSACFGLLSISWPRITHSRNKPRSRIFRYRKMATMMMIIKFCSVAYTNSYAKSMHKFCFLLISVVVVQQITRFAFRNFIYRHPGVFSFSRRQKSVGWKHLLL